MHDERCRLDRTSFAALRAEPGRCSDQAVAAAVARADFDDAAIRLLARKAAGGELPIEQVATVLLGLEPPDAFLALIGAATGDRAAVLGGLLDARRFADVEVEQLAMVMLALWRLDPSEPTRDRLKRGLRRMLLCEQTPRSLALTTWLADQLDDQAVFARLDGWQPLAAAEEKAWIAQATRSLEQTTIAQLVATFPEHAFDEPLPGIPVRAAAKPGRNEPCPCGSGQKYKKCCADKPASAAVAAAPAPGATSRAAQVAEVSHRLTPDEIAVLARVDLAAVDLARLEHKALAKLMRVQVELHDWPRAAVAIEELVRRGVGHADDWRDELVHAAIRVGAVEVVRDQLARFEDPRLGDGHRLTLALAAGDADGPVELRRLADAAVRDPSGLAAVALAHALLLSDRALGILVARGALRADRALDAEALLDSVEDARDDLLLPPGDPGWEVLTALGGASERAQAMAAGQEERARLASAADELRASLAQATARLADLERRSAEQQAELRQAERAVLEGGRRDDPDRRVLRDKIEALEARIREGNDERAALRKRAAERPGPPATGAVRAERPVEPGDDAEEDAQLEPAAGGGTRAVLIPRFSSRAQAAIEAQRRQASAEALRTLGGLCAGDPFSWRGVKQAKDMTRQVLMVRVGIHHRLLFRVDGGALEVLDLVTRESLMTTLKHLRGSGG